MKTIEFNSTSEVKNIVGRSKGNNLVRNKCEICHNTFQNELCLKEHMKNIHRENRRFSYHLNDKKTKEKLLKGAKRSVFKKEAKNTCVNLIFNDGAYVQIVLPLLRSWEAKKGNGPLEFEKANMEILEVCPGFDNHGMQTDTKIDFIANGNKMNVHAYNTTQKLTFMGKHYAEFIDYHLEPFFLQNIENYKQDIQEYNSKVIETFGKSPLKKPIRPNTRSTRMSKKVQCKRCDAICSNNSSLQKHNSSLHAQLSRQFEELEFKNESFEHSTRNNSMIPEAILNEVLDLVDDDTDAVDEKNEEENKKMIEYAGSVTNTSKARTQLQFTCGECKLKTNTKKEMDKHVKEHKETGSDESILREYICKTCEKGFEKEDDYNFHLQTHEDLKTSRKMFKCDKCKVRLSL